MMQKLQKFGAAMFVPVLLFSFAGIVVALTSLFNNPLIFGSLANTNTFWYGLWDTVQQGGWTVFNQVDMLFVVGLPIGLAKKAHGRAAMEAIVTYWTFNYFIAGFLTHWGAFFGLKDYVKTQIVANSANNGLTMIAGIKTLDTSIVGSLVIAGIVVWLHNRYFDKKLPDFLGYLPGFSLRCHLRLRGHVPSCLPDLSYLAKGTNGHHWFAGIHGIQRLDRGLDLQLPEPGPDSNWPAPLGLHSVPIRPGRRCRGLATMVAQALD